MPYASGRVIHDADAHIMEVPGFLENYLEAGHRATVTDKVLFPRHEGFHSHLKDDHRQGIADGSGFDEAQIMLAKNWDALGAYRKQDRTRSVELLGFASQLMFTTALLNYSSVLEGGRDPDLAYAVARAHTRHMVDFCSVDRRLLPTGYVPLIDFERTAKAAREAIDLKLLVDCSGSMGGDSIASATSANPEPSHVLQAMGVAPEIARGAVRVSLGAGNSESDIDEFINALRATVGRLQGLTALAV